ncbi:hypothetical protein [Microcystis phage Mel-JY01]
MNDFLNSDAIKFVIEFSKALLIISFFTWILHSFFKKWVLNETVGILKFFSKSWEMVKILLKIKK